MSKKFYAINKITGDKWKPELNKKQWLMMYDTGYLAVVEHDFYMYVTPLSPEEWTTVIKDNIKRN